MHHKKTTSGSYSLEYSNKYGKHVEASGSYEVTHKSHGHGYGHGYNHGYKTGHYNRGYGYNKG